MKRTGFLHRNITLFSTILFLFISHQSLSAQSILISDSKTHQTIKVTDPNKINRFNYYWSQMQPINKQHSYHWRYQMEIKSEQETSRWVYDLNGYARKLSIDQSSTIFNLSASRAFNRFINELSSENEKR